VPRFTRGMGLLL